MPRKGEKKKRERDEGAESAVKRRSRASEGDVAMKLGEELGEWTVVGLAGIIVSLFVGRVARHARHALAPARLPRHDIVREVACDAEKAQQQPQVRGGAPLRRGVFAGVVLNLREDDAASSTAHLRAFGSSCEWSSAGPALLHS